MQQLWPDIKRQALFERRPNGRVFQVNGHSDMKDVMNMQPTGGPPVTSLLGEGGASWRDASAKSDTETRKSLCLGIISRLFHRTYKGLTLSVARMKEPLDCS